MQQGILPFSPSQGMHLLERVLQLDSPQAMAIAVDWSRLLSLMSPPILSVLAEEVPTSRDRDGRHARTMVSLPRSSSRPPPRSGSH